MSCIAQYLCSVLSCEKRFFFSHTCFWVSGVLAIFNESNFYFKLYIYCRTSDFGIVFDQPTLLSDLLVYQLTCDCCNAEGTTAHCMTKAALPLYPRGGTTVIIHVISKINIDCINPKCLMTSKQTSHATLAAKTWGCLHEKNGFWSEFWQCVSWCSAMRQALFGEWRKNDLARIDSFVLYVLYIGHDSAFAKRGLIGILGLFVP